MTYNIVRNLSWSRKSLFGIAIITMFAFTMHSACPTVKGQNTVVIESSVSGLVNAIPLSGAGTVNVDPSIGYAIGSISFTEIASDFNPMAVSCTSILCVVNTAVCPVTLGAVNLCYAWYPDVEIDIEVDFDIYFETELIGEFSQTGVLTIVSDDYWIWDTALNGWYTGPIDLVTSPGYTCLYRQLGPGMIEGTYTQPIYRQDKTKIDSSTRRLYTYDGPRQLPFDEHMRYKIITVEYTSQILTWESEAYYTPVPVGGILVPVDKLGLLAPYIGLASTTLIATVAATIYVKRVKRRKEKR